jgi:rfaE bifunctional protein nucleotidyltransferase chain/domain
VSQTAVVTGGCGFIGSHLTERLLASGYRVVVIDNLSTGRRANLATMEANPALSVHIADIRDAAAIAPLFAGADIVYHIAALADIVPSIQRPEDYFTTNVDGTFNVMQAVRAAGVKRVVYAASSSCYGIPEVYPTPETAPLQPQYPYALTKMLGEQIVLHWSLVYNIPAVSLRFFNVYGPRARTTGTYGAVFGVFLAQRMAGKPYTVVGDGTQTRDFTYVTDIAAAVQCAGESSLSGEIINVGSGGTYSINDLVGRLGGPITYVPKRRRLARCAGVGTRIDRRGHPRLVSLLAKRTGPAMSTETQTAAGATKIYDLDALANVLDRERAAGKSVVQCHGVFDLLHVGHIRHFAEARAQGDVLVVTLTEDKHVNKGPNRPAFTETLRAEAIAALEAVDYVAISRFPTAVNAIRALKPSLYVKGPDYKNAADDVSGGIGLEEAAVRENGGRIYISDDMTFSSSALINRFMPSYSDDVHDYLAGFRSRHNANDIVERIETLRTLKTVVLGDTILDEYVYCDQMGKSAKEPVLAMRYSSTEMFAGGSLAVANHVANFCNSVELITYLGDRDPREDFVRTHLLPNVRTNFVYKSDSPTIVKRRYVESYLQSKLFEVCVLNDELLNASEDHLLCSLIDERVATADCAIVADFGHGLMTPNAIARLAERATFLAVNTQINAANIGFHTITKYPRADYICVHEGEVRIDARSRRAPLHGLVEELAAKMGGSKVLVTQGKRGSTLFASGKEFVSPAFVGSVVDRIGSGDAVLAITSLCVAAKMEPEVVSFLSNVVGAMKVQIVGNRSAIDRTALLKFVQTLLK